VTVENESFGIGKWCHLRMNGEEELVPSLMCACTHHHHHHPSSKETLPDTYFFQYPSRTRHGIAYRTINHGLVIFIAPL
jgi:hypothetical protein